MGCEVIERHLEMAKPKKVFGAECEYPKPSFIIGCYINILQLTKMSSFGMILDVLFKLGLHTIAFSSNFALNPA